MCASPRDGSRRGAGRSHGISPRVSRSSTSGGHAPAGWEPSVVEGRPREAARGSTVPVRLLLLLPPPAPSSCLEKQVHTLSPFSLFCLMFPVPSSQSFTSWFVLISFLTTIRSRFSWTRLHIRTFECHDDMVCCFQPVTLVEVRLPAFVFFAAGN